MKRSSLLWSFCAKDGSPNTLALLGGVLLCFVPAIAQAQSVTFAGAVSILPTSVLAFPQGFAADSAGDVFIADTNNHRILELQLTPNGYLQLTLPIFVDYPEALTVDASGDLFVVDSTHAVVLEFPKTPTGYGTPTTLPFTVEPASMAIDNAGDFFGYYETEASRSSENGYVAELPKTETGYGSQTLLPFPTSIGLNDVAPTSLAVDAAGDVFVPDMNPAGILELPKSSTGFGSLITLPSTGSAAPYGIALGPTGNLFAIGGNNQRIVELPKTPTGYGSRIILPTAGIEPFYIAADGAGDVFVLDAFDTLLTAEVQLDSVNFLDANVCGAGTTPAPCSVTLPFNFNINAAVTLGTPKVLTGSAPGADFTLASGNTCTGTFAKGATCTLNVTFTPQAIGTRNGSVQITDGSGNTITTTLISGLGVNGAAGQPVAQLSTTELDFGTVSYGTTDHLPLTVTNAGGGALSLTPTFNGQSFSIPNNTCTTPLSRGNSCTFQIYFNTISAIAHNDILTLGTNGPSNPTVKLTGTATGVSANTKQLSFPEIPFGASEIQTITLTNTATSGTVTISATTTAPSYKVLTTSQNTCQSGLAAGHSCVLPVQFAPVVVGQHEDYLHIVPSADGPNISIELGGDADGVGAGTSFSPGFATPLNFGTIPYGTTKVLLLPITNFGVSATVQVGTSISGNSFKVLNNAQNTCLSGVGEFLNCTLPIEFAPTSAGAHNELLTLTPNAGQASSVVHLDGIEAAP